MRFAALRALLRIGAGASLRWMQGERMHQTLQREAVPGVDQLDPPLDAARPWLQVLPPRCAVSRVTLVDAAGDSVDNSLEPGGRVNVADRVLAEGPPEAVVAAGTHTGQALAPVLARGRG
jgi:hypothetical protein